MLGSFGESLTAGNPARILRPSHPDPLCRDSRPSGPGGWGLVFETPGVGAGAPGSRRLDPNHPGGDMSRLVSSWRLAGQSTRGFVRGHGPGGSGSGHGEAMRGEVEPPGRGAPEPVEDFRCVSAPQVPLTRRTAVNSVGID